MKPKDKILTYEQARELQWFARNCTGLRSEYYPLKEKVEAFSDRLDRLEKTCEMIEKYFKEHGNPLEAP